MKNLLLTLSLCLSFFIINAQTDSVLTVKSEIMNQTEFEIYDTLNYNQIGSDEWQLTEWFCDDNAEITEPAIKKYTQYKIDGKGIRSKRTMEIKYIPSGMVYGEKNIWHEESKNIQLYFTYKQNAELMQSDYGINLLNYFNSINPLIYNESEGIYIYLTELYQEHRIILESFDIRVKSK